jgi:outer membrane protein
VPASTPLEIVVPELAMEDLTIAETPEEIYDVSTKTLPQVKSALLKVESAEAALRAARAVYYPRISLTYAAVSNYNSASDRARYGVNPTGAPIFPTIGYVNGDPTQAVISTQPVPAQYLISDSYHVKDQLNDNLYKNLGLSLSFPILNGFQTRTNVQQAVINQELANITVKETQNTLRQSIETAYNDAVAAAKTYTAAIRQVNANEEAFRMTQQRHQIGAATYIEYQVASNDLFSAKSSLARAKYNFILKKKVLEFYQGKQIEY